MANQELDPTARAHLQEHGYCIIPNVLDRNAVREIRAALLEGATTQRRQGIPTHMQTLDPNASNVRVWNLPEVSPLFMALLSHPVALQCAEAVLGPYFLASNFTANIALPGSKPMRLHSDQALVIPPPWLYAWAMNVIWCLDDVHERNGATRHLPDSHRYTSFEALPADAEQHTVAFEAPVGSLIAMEGRLWHTSGANVTANEERAMLFAYYSPDFIRQQTNWEATLSPATKASLDPELRQLLGMGPVGNVRIGGTLTRLPAIAAVNHRL